MRFLPTGDRIAVLSVLLQWLHPMRLDLLRLDTDGQ